MNSEAERELLAIRVLKSHNVALVIKLIEEVAEKHDLAYLDCVRYYNENRASLGAEDER